MQEQSTFHASSRELGWGSKSRGQWVGGTFAHDRGPFPDCPLGDQATRDVWVVFGELLHHGFRTSGKQQRGAIDRVGERAGEPQFAPRHRGARMFQVGAAELRAALEDVGNERI